MLFDHLGETEAAARVEAAVAADLVSRDPRAPGGTAEIGERLAKAASA
jgi:3-isopropylmalate dehydrogenase